jgi:anti-anti-sigma factor
VAEYDVTRIDRRGIVTPKNRLTAVMVPELQTELRNLLAQGVDEVVFDLADTAMVDSSGMGLLIAAANSLARTRGVVRVIHASSDIVDLFRSMRLTERLNVSGRAEQGAFRE